MGNERTSGGLTFPRRLQQFLGSLLVFCVIFLSPALLNPFVSSVLPVNQDRLRIAKLRPRLVIIGNSLAQTHVDVEYLSQITGQPKIIGLFNAGSHPNLWFFRFKNDFVASGAPPGTIIFFFYENLLTYPVSLPYNQKQKMMVSRKMLPDEPLQRKAIENADLLQKTAFYLKDLYRISLVSDVARWYLDNLSLFISHPSYRQSFFDDPLPRGEERNTMRKAFLERVNGVFAVENQRSSQDSPIQQTLLQDGVADIKDVTDFYHALDKSYLPEIIRLGRDAGCRLIFVRTKLHPGADGNSRQRPGLDDYERHLEYYLAENGAMFLDFSRDPQLTPDKLQDGFHLRDSERRWFTAYFATKLAGVLQNDIP